MEVNSARSTVVAVSVAEFKSASTFMGVKRGCEEMRKNLTRYEVNSARIGSGQTGSSKDQQRRRAPTWCFWSIRSFELIPIQLLLVEFFTGPPQAPGPDKAFNCFCCSYWYSATPILRLVMLLLLLPATPALLPHSAAATLTATATPPATEPALLRRHLVGFHVPTN